VKIQFERTPNAICAVLYEPGECDRTINVDRASDAFRVFKLSNELAALNIDPTALKPLDALFTYARIVCVEIEQRAGGRWRVEVAYWCKGLGTLVQHETEASSLLVALTQALTGIDV